MAVLVSWRDRDWARFTDEERRLLYGGGSGLRSVPSLQTEWSRLLVWGLVVMALAAVIGFAWATRSHRASPSPPRPGPVVYGEQLLATVTGGLYRADEGLTCTTEAVNVRYGVWVCEGFAIVQPGQVARTAVASAGPCGVRHVDQATGRWVCDHVTRPTRVRCQIRRRRHCRRAGQSRHVSAMAESV
jgi:hypothetical protein